MLKVLGKPTSINLRKVLWTCEEIGRPVQDYYERLSARPGFRLHGRNGMP